MTQPQTVPAALRAAAAAHADRAAVVDGATTLTFRDLHAAVRDTARGYVALGLEPGDTVCLWAPNTWEWVVAGLAVTYAGGVLVPVNTRYKGEEVADIVERSGARLCVVADGFLGRSQVEELRAARLARGLGLRVTAVVSIGTTTAAGTTAFSSWPTSARASATSTRSRPAWARTTSPTSSSPPAPPVAPRACSPPTRRRWPRPGCGRRTARSPSRTATW